MSCECARPLWKANFETPFVRNITCLACEKTVEINKGKACSATYCIKNHFPSSGLVSHCECGQYANPYHFHLSNGKVRYYGDGSEEMASRSHAKRLPDGRTTAEY